MTSSNSPVIWVTGAGSGMGRAAAVAIAPGARVVLSGRRPAALEETAALVRQAGGEALPLELDVTDAAAIDRAHDRIVATWGPVSRLVLAAGLNSPKRAWADQDLAEFESIVATNLTGVVRVVQAVLPGMRQARDGVIVIISSYAGWRLSSSPGVAYSASKVALSAIATTLNGQEAANGIRTTHLCPGDVNTDFLLMRPTVPDGEARATMLAAEDIGRCVRFVIDSPAHVVVDELVISPTSQTR